MAERLQRQSHMIYAEQLGFSLLSNNDHLRKSKGWVCKVSSAILIPYEMLKRHNHNTQQSISIL